MMRSYIDALRGYIREAQKVVVFTGAGVSTDSGIPDFRSPGGLWSKYNPEDFYFHKFLTSESSRKIYWRMYKEFFKALHQAKPSAAHYACKILFDLEKLYSVITQNVDGLHQMAGVPGELVLELHGNARIVRCLRCGKTYDSIEIEQWLERGVEIPTCDECGGLLKPATVSFGQALPHDVLTKAEFCAQTCDLLLAVGSSLTIYPAASIPLLAKKSGAKLVIVNLEPTSYDESADLSIHGNAGLILTESLKGLF